MVKMNNYVGSHENPAAPQIIKEEDKFFSRLLSKENSSANSSCRVYYGGIPGAIPFTWESRPGTPKHHSLFSDSSSTQFPPLTPPPSYFSKSSSNPIPKNNRRGSSNIKQSLLKALFLKCGSGRKNHVTPTSSSSLSSSVSFSSSSSSTWSEHMSWKIVGGRRRCFSWSSSSPLTLDGEVGEEEERENGGLGCRNSTLCLRGCYGR